jgi:protocatechuate 3,4-dioxygenase beta subunit
MRLPVLLSCLSISGSIAFGVAVLAQNPGSEALAAVEGVVTNQVTDTPIGGVMVSLEPESGQTRTTKTDAEGKFDAKGLMPGRYRINLSKEGFFKPRHSTDPFNVTLSPGQNFTNARFQLAPGGMITGHILDEAGQPKKSVLVHALRPEYENGIRVLSPCDRSSIHAFAPTDASGAYRLSSLEPGKYYVSAATDRNCANGYYPNVTDPADSTLVVVKSGAETSGIDLHLQKVEMHSVRFRVDEPLSSVIDPSGPSFEIVRKSRNGLETIERLNFSDSSFRKDGADTYVSPALTAGSFELYYSPDSLGFEIGKLAFDIVGSDIDAGTMVVQRIPALAARIRGDLPGGLNLKKLGVLVVPLDRRTKDPFNLWAENMAAEDGTFSVAYPHITALSNPPGTIAEGRYRILGISGLPPDMYLASAVYGGHDVLEDGGLAVDGGPASRLELTVAGPGGTVEGIVQNNKNEVIPNSQVALVPSAAHRANLNLYKTAFTDQYGTFSIRGVAPGDYSVLAWDDVEPGAWLNADFLKEFETRSTKVTVSGGAISSAEVRLVQTSN